MSLTEEIFLGTWRFDETIRDQAAVKAFSGTVEEANEWSAYAPDVLEFKMQGDNTYLEGGLYRHRFFLQAVVRDPEIDFIIRYYTRSEGNWFYDTSKGKLIEITSDSYTMCMDEETEKETKNDKDLRSMFRTYKGETEHYSVERVDRDTLVITEDELNLRLRLRRVPLKPALEIKE